MRLWGNFARVRRHRAIQPLDGSFIENLRPLAIAILISRIRCCHMASLGSDFCTAQAPPPTTGTEEEDLVPLHRRSAWCCPQFRMYVST